MFPKLGWTIQKYLKPPPRVFFLEGKQPTDFFFVEADLAFGDRHWFGVWWRFVWSVFSAFLFWVQLFTLFFPHFWNGFFFGWMESHKKYDVHLFWRQPKNACHRSILCLQPKVPNVKALVVPMHLSLMEVDGWVESPARRRVFNEWKLPSLVRQSTV